MGGASKDALRRVRRPWKGTPKAELGAGGSVSCDWNGERDGKAGGTAGYGSWMLAGALGALAGGF